MISFDVNFEELSSLMQGLVKLLLKVTMSLGNNTIDKEQVGQYNMSMVPLLLLLLDDVVFLLLPFYAAFKEWVINFIVTVIENYSN